MKDIQPFDGHHDPVTVNYLAVGCEYNQCLIEFFNLFIN